MKTLKLFLICILLISASCKNDDTPTNPIDQLPPATQTGANTAGALVNGEAFLPFGIITGGNLNLFYTDGLNFGLSIGEKRNNILKNINVTSLNESLEVGQIYSLLDFEDNSKYGLFSIDVFSPPSPNFYQTTTNIIGELTITHHDFNNAILSGTFWFDAINSVGEIVEV
jgi:hypothetical protein